MMYALLLALVSWEIRKCCCLKTVRVALIYIRSRSICQNSHPFFVSEKWNEASGAFIAYVDKCLCPRVIDHLGAGFVNFLSILDRLFSPFVTFFHFFPFVVQFATILSLFRVHQESFFINFYVHFEFISHESIFTLFIQSFFMVIPCNL